MIRKIVNKTPWAGSLLIIILIAMLVFSVAGCSGDTATDNKEGGENDFGSETGESQTEENKNGLYEKIYVDVDLQNDQSDEYYLFFVKPGTVGTNGDATSLANFFGPIEIENFKTEVEFMYNTGVNNLLDELDEKKLQLVITTREDHLIRNPLNEETFIYFEKDEELFSNYLPTQEKFEMPIVDKYPDGVLSLPWPDADFVIKLRFKEGITPRSSYGVRIREFSDSTSSGLGLFAPGSPLSNRGNYYNAVFYSENMKGFAGVLEIEGQQPNTVMYEGQPLTIKFDEDGKPIGDDVIEVVITEGE